MTAREKSIVPRLRDDDGEWVEAGDVVRFSFGIPPVLVDATIIEREGNLIGLCPMCNPPEFRLRSLRRYVGNWYKHNSKPSNKPTRAEGGEG